jgi:hypothetical protein
VFTLFRRRKALYLQEADVGIISSCVTDVVAVPGVPLNRRNNLTGEGDKKVANDRSFTEAARWR